MRNATVISNLDEFKIILRHRRMIQEEGLHVQKQMLKKLFLSS